MIDATGLRYLPWYPIAGGSGEGDPPPADPPPSDPPTSGDKDGSKDERTFTKAELATAVQDALSRERKKAEDAQRKLTEDAETKRLTDQQEFKALADKHETRVRELEPQAQQAERYAAALAKHLDTQRKDLPKHLTDLLDKLDAADQLEWIAANAAELSKGQNGAIRETPRGSGQPGETHDQAVDRIQKRMANSGAYG